MSKAICYYPEHSTRGLFKYEDRAALSAALDDALKDHVAQDVQSIISAFLIQPISKEGFQHLTLTLSSKAVTVALDQELLYAATLTSQMIAEYLRKYQQSETTPAFNLQHLAQKAPRVEKLYVSEEALADLAKYRRAFPQINELILQGNLPLDQTIDANGLETLDVFCLKVSKDRELHQCIKLDSSTSLRRLVGLKDPRVDTSTVIHPESPLLQSMLLSYMSTLAIEQPLKEELLAALQANRNCLELMTPLGEFESSFYQEWELNLNLSWRKCFDVRQELGLLPASPLPPLSTVRDLTLSRYLPLPADLCMTVSDYLTERLTFYASSYFPIHGLGVGEEESCKLTVDQALKMFFRQLRQATHFDLSSLQEDYQKINGGPISLNELLEKSSPTNIDGFSARAISSEDLNTILKRFINLRTVYLEDCSGLTEQDIQKLLRIPHLEHVSLPSNHSYHARAEQISSFRKQIRELKTAMREARYLGFGTGTVTKTPFVLTPKDSDPWYHQRVFALLPDSFSESVWLETLATVERELLQKIDRALTFDLKPSLPKRVCSHLFKTLRQMWH